MKKEFRLPLLASLPALLAACGDSDDLSHYGRVQYSSYQQCMLENQKYIQQGLPNPCQKTSSGRYYGPYIRYYSGGTRYVGYTAAGNVDSRGLRYDSKKGTYGSFKAPVSRGGLTSSSRASRSGGGIFGG